ncbi:MFS transporter [Deinococcus detaillensis]|uniref:MFS transporter n=1 Tax=Deinococcus detaillensis TaxID=2592048 RepID=A0A553V5M1_9DEIO|nr:MFS transporter [Deinococcus detaillensis]TSA87769.1 MFS transporter [Deinococcus detaillensis]
MSLTLPTTSQPAVSKAQALSARWATSAVFFANGMVMATWVVRVPSVQGALQLSPATVGIALLGMSVGSLLAMPQTGHLAARYGTRRVTVTAGVLMMLALILPFLAPNLWLLFAALSLLGAGNGVMDVAMNAQGVAVERWLAKPVMSSFHAAYSLGNLAGAGLGSLLLGWHLGSVSHALLITLSMSAVVLLAGAKLLPKRADEPDREPEPDAPPEYAPSQAAPANSSSVNPSNPNTLIWMLGLLCFLGMMGEGSLGDWSGLYSKQVLSLSGAALGAAYTAFTLAMTVGRVFGDGWRSRYGDQRVVMTGALLSGAGLCAGLLTLNPSLMVLGSLVFGLGVANVVPVLYGTVGKVLAGHGIARVATIGYAGFLTGPPLIGFVSQLSSLRWGMTLIALSLLLVGLLTPRVYRRLSER